MSSSGDPIDCSLPGFSVHGILQARILKWVAVPPPGDLQDPGIEPVSLEYPSLAGKLFITGTTWEARYILTCLELCALNLLYSGPVRTWPRSSWHWLGMSMFLHSDILLRMKFYLRNDYSQKLPWFYLLIGPPTVKIVLPSFSCHFWRLLLSICYKNHSHGSYFTVLITFAVSWTDPYVSWNSWVLHWVLLQLFHWWWKFRSHSMKRRLNIQLYGCLYGPFKTSKFCASIENFQEYQPVLLPAP